MAVDFVNYSGREQAFVKHTFLDKYLPALVARISSKFDEFVYVDGFAGPWKSVTGETFDDTSFGIALRHMVEQKKFWASRGRTVSMRAFLVERGDAAFRQLRKAVSRFPSLEITPLHGRMEDHAASIAGSIPKSAFSFSLVDPKGFPQVAPLKPVLERQNAEVLVNFMFDFANRFVGKDLIPALEEWLSATAPDGSWRDDICQLSGAEREEIIERLAAESLHVTGDYKYAPVISVDKVRHDRTLYKLIFLSRRVEGLKVFRDSQLRALTAQATARSSVKARERAKGTSNMDFFADGEDAVPHDRSSRVMQCGEARASKQLIQQIAAAGPAGITWKELWPGYTSGLRRHPFEFGPRGERTAPRGPGCSSRMAQ